MPVTFRCASCGALEPAGAAGELERPAACHICGAGVSFDPRTGQKSYDPDNWQVLAELPANRLKALGLTAADIDSPAAPAKEG